MTRLTYLMLVSLILAFSLTTILADDEEISPYENTQIGKPDKTQSMLSIASDLAKQKATPGKEKLKIRIFNNSDATIYVVEQNVFVDFHFQVKNSLGEVIPPNQEFTKIMHNRMAWWHISRGFEPGEFGFYDVNLSKIYDLVPSETYTVQAWRYVSNKEFGPATQIQTASNVLQFTAPQ